MRFSFGGSRGSRGIVGGLVIGCLMFFGSFALLWWNEGNALAQFQTIDDLEEYTVDASPASVDPAHDGMPVYLSAEAETDVELIDEAFDVRKVALRLRRVAEMYQWDEDEDRDNDTVTYRYDRVWSEAPIDSTGFHDRQKRNPPTMPYRTESWFSDEVALGPARALPRFLIEDLDGFEPLAVAGADPAIEGLQRTADGFYLGGDPGSPEIGDVRISFEIIPPGVLSLIAAQRADTFETWTSARTGRGIHKIKQGVHTKAELIQMLVTEARVFMWALRAGGFVMMFIGLLALTAPIRAAVRWVPVLGSIVESGAAVIALLVAGILSISTIVVAWIAHRPLVGVSLCLVVGGLAFLLVKTVKKPKRGDLAYPPPPPPPVV